MTKSSIAASSAAIAITEDVNTVHVACCVAISSSVVGVMASRFLALGTVSPGKVLVTDYFMRMHCSLPPEGSQLPLLFPSISSTIPGWSAVDWMT